MIAPRHERAVDALALMTVKLAVGAWVLYAGFTHVSDDDYARTVIAQQFAHAPRLDPSGTSWLPFPFWLEGTTMMAFGRTLPVARALALALGCVTVAAPYLAMREMGMRRAAALVATAIAMTSPWNAWLGVATVPEGWAGAIVAGAILAMPGERARPWAATGLLVGALCRYEAWPACLVAGALCTHRGMRDGRLPRELSCAAVVLLGPAAWMAWNAYAHGSALHFVTRVTTFRQAIGAAAVPMADKLLGYPRALVSEAPVAAALGVAGALGLVKSEARARWAWPLGTALGIVVFLVWGDVRDGAPTHHAARALVVVVWVLVAAGVDAIFTVADRAAATRPTRLAMACGAAVLGAVVVVTTVLACMKFPGGDQSENRHAQIVRGLDLRDRHVASAVVTPCSFEHFALLAAWGEPERAELEPRTGATPTRDCPRVVER